MAQPSPAQFHTKRYEHHGTERQGKRRTFHYSFNNHSSTRRADTITAKRVQLNKKIKPSKNRPKTEMGSPSFSESFKLLQTILCLSLLFITSSPSIVASQAIDRKPTAYEMLETYDFPIGILPKGVRDYELDASTGKFSAFLSDHSCSFSLDGSYQLNYKSTIKGCISNGKISSLEGVSVKLFFLWVDIIEVSRHGDNLDFSVGIAGAGFPIDNFEVCPQCGCGLNCNRLQQKVGKIRTKLTAS